jgi:hypothetical protein
MSHPDPAARLFQHARREALIVLAVWAVALAWTVGWCYLRGYEHAAESWPVRAGLAEVRTAADVRLTAGFPDWVFYGIVLPWFACTAFTVGFCLFVMTDDDLGTEAGEGGGHGA